MNADQATGELYACIAVLADWIDEPSTVEEVSDPTTQELVAAMTGLLELLPLLLDDYTAAWGAVEGLRKAVEEMQSGKTASGLILG